MVLWDMVCFLPLYMSDTEHFSLKAHEATLEARASPEMSDRIQQLEREITRYKDESSKAQAEVDRLLEILKEVENEKNDKDKKIAELER